MNDEIIEILEGLNHISNSGENASIEFNSKDCKLLSNCIINLQEENERLKEQNNDLRKLYRNTYQRLFNNGNDELAGYFQAQINDCPTFYVEPIIDYHKEWKDYKSRCEKANWWLKEMLKQAKSDETKAIINGTLELLLNGSDE